VSSWPSSPKTKRDHREPVALICYGDGGRTASWTFWATVAEARQADAECTPCSKHCVGVHTIIEIPKETHEP
jgi:hypothetical protein